jgi:hypothetical protein
MQPQLDQHVVVGPPSSCAASMIASMALRRRMSPTARAGSLLLDDLGDLVGVHAHLHGVTDDLVVDVLRVPRRRRALSASGPARSAP